MAASEIKGASQGRSFRRHFHGKRQSSEISRPLVSHQLRLQLFARQNSSVSITQRDGTINTLTINDVTRKAPRSRWKSEISFSRERRKPPAWSELEIGLFARASFPRLVKLIKKRAKRGINTNGKRSPRHSSATFRNPETAGR